MLSKYEMELVCDAQVILTKNGIIKKVADMFGFLGEEFAGSAKGQLPPELTMVPAKVSKGEKYEGLPYLILDYPRNFSKEDTFSIRCLFWWGNFFSITLHLSGSHQLRYLPGISKAIKENVLQNWYYCINEDQWQHHFEEYNYKEITAGLQIDSTRSFVKIARKIPLQDWEKSMKFFSENFQLLLSIIKIQLPIL